MRNMIRDRSGNLLGSTMTPSPNGSSPVRTMLTDRSGNLLGSSINGKAYDRSGNLIGDAALLTTLLPTKR